MRESNPPLRLMLALGILFGAGCTCDSSEQGYLRAPEGGDLSHSLSRPAFDQDIAASCSPLGMQPGGEAVLTRQPYLHVATDAGLVLVWASDAALQLDWQGGSGSTTDLVAAHDDSVATGKQYIAALGPLDLDVIYCYQLRHQNKVIYRGGFRSPPSQSTKVHISVLGDVGKSSPDQAAVFEALQSVRSDLVLFSGDLAYDSGTLTQFEKYFFGVYNKLLALVPILPASGNHDYQSDEAAAFREVFVLPGNERWYSVTWGPVHIAVLDTEVSFEEQAEFLDTDLRATSAPWKIVLLHKPPYSSGTHGSDMQVRDAWESIFVRHGVHLVLAGHDHNYERSTSIDGVVYVVTGGGGRGTRPVGKSAFTAFAARVAHLVSIEADANRLTLHAIDGTGQMFDSLLLEN